MPPSHVDSTNASVLARLLEAPQYRLNKTEKSELLLRELALLTESHYERCEAYRDILDGTRRCVDDSPSTMDDVPFLPVRLFKSLNLRSVPDSDVVRVLTSSGTTSQEVSKIAIDRETASLQTKALASIITSFIGPKRLPMVVVDSAAILRNRDSMSARGAGLVGLSNFGRDHFYALDDGMKLDVAGLKAFAERHAGHPILIFGFTFMVWQYLCQYLRRSRETLPLMGGVLIHSGGWKKLESEAVTNEVFRQTLRELCGITLVHNFYGMVEQVGGIYMECEHGFLHAPNVADIVIRSRRHLSVLPPGESGLIQTLSALPRSYPGHSLLTEDLGTIYGSDDCPCGRLGVRFKVHGRAPQAELRGCSDTHAFSRPAETTGVTVIRRFLPETAEASAIEALCPMEFFGQSPLPAFDPVAIAFLDHVSAAILKLPDAKQYPELTALAFWLRKANLHSIIDPFLKTITDREVVQPLGTAFHVAPSNVDTIFLYSWALAMLAGNSNIVRVSQNISPQLGLLLGAVKQVLADSRWEAIRQRNIVLTYPRDNHVSQYLSKQADARLLWGGDETVLHLRSLAAKPATRDISFADKLSSCVIHAERFLSMGDELRAQTARAFYNDAYPFDQMACSSPHFVIFAGVSAACVSASTVFWNAIAREVEHRQPAEPVSGIMHKLVSAYEVLGRRLEAKWISGWSPFAPGVVRVPLQKASLLRSRLGGGFFVETTVPELDALLSAIRREDQTLSYIGYSQVEMKAAARTLAANGIDRIVPVGQALNFGPIWDGYMLLSELSRRVQVL